ncbi:hypothetical protein QUB67_16865 [Microcoleus sp. ARI1-A1]
MIETYAQSETKSTRRDEGSEELRIDPDGGENVGRTGEGTRSLSFPPDREGGAPGITLNFAIGGILDQLIDDARKQLVKSNECIVWYQSEAREYEEKLQNLLKLKELQQQEIANRQSQTPNLEQLE